MVKFKPDLSKFAAPLRLQIIHNNRCMFFSVAACYLCSAAFAQQPVIEGLANLSSYRGFVRFRVSHGTGINSAVLDVHTAHPTEVPIGKWFEVRDAQLGNRKDHAHGRELRHRVGQGRARLRAETRAYEHSGTLSLEPCSPPASFSLIDVFHTLTMGEEFNTTLVIEYEV